jgi:hypothetical protein
MAAKTRLGFEGYGVRRAGSFAGKAVAAITAVLAKTDAVDTASMVMTFVRGSTWINATVEAETWIPATIQSETWTSS